MEDWELNRVASLLFNARRILKRTQLEGPLPDDGDLLRRAFRVARPSTLESFLVALVSVVDTIMVSSLGAAAIAAIGLTGQPKFICLAVFLSVNVAVSAIVARRKGEGDREGANRVLVQAILITVVLTVVITALALIFAEPVLRLAGTNEDTHELATGYFRIIVGCQFFNVLNMVINAAQCGVGNKNCDAYQYCFKSCEYCVQLPAYRRKLRFPGTGGKRRCHRNSAGYCRSQRNGFALGNASRQLPLLILQ